MRRRRRSKRRTSPAQRSTTSKNPKPNRAAKPKVLSLVRPSPDSLGGDGEGDGGGGGGEGDVERTGRAWVGNDGSAGGKSGGDADVAIKIVGTDSAWMPSAAEAAEAVLRAAERAI